MKDLYQMKEEPMTEILIKPFLPVLLAGCGYMGRLYLKILLEEIGIDEHHIIVVEREASKRKWCADNYPNVKVYDDVEKALAAKTAKPKTLLNITNSPDHKKVMQAALEANIFNHFVEKPIVLPKDLAFLNRVPNNAKIGVGYLINFSPAIEKLFELMEQQNLIVHEGKGFWGKDRIGDSRPTSGDLEDEATHPLATLLSAVELHQRIAEMEVQATLSHLPFVNQQAQEKARQQDSSYPAEPTATSHVALRLTNGSGRKILLTVNSSFISFGQERRIELVLGSANQDSISALARIDFDVQGEDTLSWRKAGSKESAERWSFPGKNKLADQLRAFLFYAADWRKDPRLSDLHHAKKMVQISKAALDSNDRGSLVKIV